MYDGRATLYLGISPAMVTDAFRDRAQGILLEPSVDLFVGVPLSSSISIRGGGFVFTSNGAFLPTFGLAWTL